MSAAGLLICGGKEKLAMFEQTFVADGKTRRERTIAVALVLQALGVIGLALLPLIRAETIGAGKRFTLLPPALGKPETPEIKRAATSRSSAPNVRIFRPETLIRSFVAPTHIVALGPSDAPTLNAGDTANTGMSNGLLSGLGDGGYVAPPPIRVAPIPKPARAPVRISSQVTQSQLVFGPKPEYPRLALSARIEGTVRLQAMISRDGRIENLHVLSGHPLLDGPAMAAVRDWRYRPLLLNGEPVAVITEIDVNFTLSASGR